MNDQTGRIPATQRILLIFLLSVILLLPSGPAFSGTAKVAWIHHANQALADNGAHALRPGCSGYVGNSFHRTIDTHEYWNVPVDIHMSGPLIQSYGWMQNDNDLLSRLSLADFVDIAGGFYAENIAPYASDEMNRFALSYQKDIEISLIKGPGFPSTPTVIWIPERVWKNESLMSYSLIAAITSQYGKWDGDTWLAPVIVLDGETAHDWYHHTYPDGSTCHNPHKVHMMWDNWGNYVFVVFIDRTARDNWVWNDASVPGNPLNQLLWNLHNDWDQEQVVIYGDDWEKAAGVAGWDFGQAGVPADSYDHNIAWVSTQDWIQPVHIGEVARWWGTDKLNDGDPYNDPPVIDISYTAYPELHGWTGGTYDNWYNDFKSTQAYDCENAPDYNSNGISGDYEDLWLGAYYKLMAVSPDNGFAHLGWVTLMSQLYETAWHDWDDGAGGYRLTPWDKTMWNHTRHAEAFAEAANWFNNLGSISGSQIEVGDFDGDGIDEYALYNDRIFAVFDSRGARCTFMFNSSGECIIGNSATNWGGQGDWDDGGHTGFAHDSQYENRIYNVTVDTLSGSRVHLTFTKGASFTKGVALEEDKDYLELYYQGVDHNWIKSAVSPGLKDLMLNGYDLKFIEGLSENGWLYAGYKNKSTGAKACYLWGDGQNLDYNNKGKLSSVAEKIELGGISGSYEVYLYGGSGTPEVDKIGPGDLQGPLFTYVYQDPPFNILPGDRVIVAAYVSDPSGVSEVDIHGTNSFPFEWIDFPLTEDDGGAHDWDGDGEPDQGLYGISIPPQPSGTTVVYALKAVDTIGNESWDNNDGENYSYTVGEVEFTMDGELDDIAENAAVNGGMNLWAFYSAEEGELYVATQAAGNDSDDEFSNDHFIFVSTGPDTMLSAPWSKSGEVGDWIAVLGDENDSEFCGWFDRSGITLIPEEYAESASGPAGAYLEGVLHIGNYLGYNPPVIYLAVGSYETADNGHLEWQVPRWNGTQPDGNIDTGEFDLFYKSIHVTVNDYPHEASAGSSTSWTIMITNDSDTSTDVDYWIETSGPLEATVYLGSKTVPAHETSTFVQNLNIPSGTPTGMYTVSTVVGNFPDVEIDSSDFHVNLTAKILAQY